MSKQFETERFDLVKTDRVQIADYRFGNNERGKLDVWIESSDKGKTFLSQVLGAGNKYTKQTGVSTKECYILREKAIDNYSFLDMNDCGIWLFNDAFCGAETFHIDETKKIQEWLTGAH